ncbi:TDP-4-keto-6-deoxy-D-glucose transaminase [Parvibaculum lavamentivorans DS-1]|uniref:TDP-4-keto-6-deoxy-D-glucose transaminase n=1 Tax=Parvibaculum lavamentivorans (strain DS-1 / DSM 13023 / NCIMB 13966) TaxID=402881 RepID=A7HYE1_PARL1|nr:dTDP-4-amino-4,6-dideoxygalactose transaminase [Parvibaculum lavamentivorans]ABS64924.1 TDP-4-keto-6-deoxy-D-glucose transaminase [Parvibaculum lavamentivorans DS-1]
MAVVPFNVASVLGREMEYIEDAIRSQHISGNGKYTSLCSSYLVDHIGSSACFLTPSCTDALEMSALLADLHVGDEVIMPSYTFTSTANAVVLRGAVPVFVDIRRDTLNIDETLIEQAITSRTKAIMVVHYAGVGCEMDAILEIARRYDLIVIEDAAQGLYADYRGKPLGSFGHLSAFSFHETKNIVSGEGGALMINDSKFIDRGEILWEKGTNRVKYKRGIVNKYNWVDVGSSFLPSEITSAFLYAQLEVGRQATDQRLALWQAYHDAFRPLQETGKLSIPNPPDHCAHNGHIFYILAPTAKHREIWLDQLGVRDGINAVIHYVPLHSAPAGLRFGRSCGEMTVTDEISARLVRLPLHLQLSPDDVSRVIQSVERLPV